MSYLWIKLQILRGKRHFKPTSAVCKYVNSRKKIYLLGCWARYGVMEHAFEYYRGDMPYVWYYNDHNGCYEELVLMPITHTTTGAIYKWGFNEQELRDEANTRNKAEGLEFKENK